MMRPHEDAEAAIARALQAIPQLRSIGALPPVLEPLVELAPHPGKLVNVLVRRGAAGDGILISFAAAGLEQEALAPEQRDALLATLLRLVDEAERHPRFSFLALKFLRDRVLPGSGEPAFASPGVCRGVVEEALRLGCLRTVRVANPKNPEFPVTAVQLARDNPETQRLVGAEPGRSEGPPAAAPPADESQG